MQKENRPAQKCQNIQFCNKMHQCKDIIFKMQSPWPISNLKISYKDLGANDKPSLPYCHLIFNFVPLAESRYAI